MTAADRYPLSGLDYTTWSNKMVSEGKMTWPTTSSESTEQVSPLALPWNLKSVACSTLGANKILYSAGEAQFCRLVRQYVGGVLHGAQVIMTNELCNGEGCVMFIDVSFGVGGAFVRHGIPEICEHLFEAIWRDCKGTGGSAELTIGSETGFVDAAFYPDDTSATCPADTRTDVCRKVVF